MCPPNYHFFWWNLLFRDNLFRYLLNLTKQMAGENPSYLYIIHFEWYRFLEFDRELIVSLWRNFINFRFIFWISSLRNMWWYRVFVNVFITSLSTRIRRNKFVVYTFYSFFLFSIKIFLVTTSNYNISLT